MASELQNSIFSAFDTIIGQRIESLELDKTVVASIERCEDATQGKYRVQYKGGSMIAYSQNDEAYSPHVSVYVSIPQNDFSQKKWILGKVSSLKGDRAVTEVSAAIEDYQLVGNNTVSVVGTETEFGLKSYQPAAKESDVSDMPLIPGVVQADILPLYIRGEAENKLDIDEAAFAQYIKNSCALLIEASFRTDLNSSQRSYANKGVVYGLEFSLVFEDGNGAIESLGKQFADFADITVITQYTEDGEEGQETKTVYLLDLDTRIREKIEHGNEDELMQALKSVDGILEVYLNDQEDLETQVNVLIEFYQNMVKDLIAITSSPNTTIADVKKEYEAWFEAESKTPAEKRVIYSLNSDNMLGNPFLYRAATDQYDIFPIDSGKFKYVESIVFYCQHFEANADYQTTEPDIFVSEIELYGLQELSSKNGDYYLKMQFPQGQIFEVANTPEETANKKLETLAKFYYKQELLTTGLEYYWFVKDGRVSSAGHNDYHIRGGVGWRYLEDVQQLESSDPAVQSGSLLTTYAKDNTAYENVYKCVAVYQETVSLKAEFTLYNRANQRTILIESSLGTRFDFDRGTPILTCKLLDDIMIEEEPGSYPTNYGDYTYRYVWMRKDETGQTITYDKTYEDYKTLYDSLIDPIEKVAVKKKMAEVEGVVFNKNTLEYPASKIAANTNVIFECYVYRTKEESEEVFIGSALIALTNKASIIRDEYYVVIDNGNQVFQYNEFGVLPDSKTTQDPITTKPLSCRLYDSSGLEVNSSLYTVTWEYPVDNSLLILPTEGIVENPATKLMQWHHGAQTNFEVVRDYDYTALNNQIKCIVEYDGKQVIKLTEFYFGKVGDNGTNGTDVTAVIEPWAIDNDLDDAPLTLIVTPDTAHWNSGLIFNEATTPLSLSLFRKNEYIDPSEYKGVKWTVAGGASKSNMFAASANEFNPHMGHVYSGSGKYSNYIIKAEAKLNKVDGSTGTQTHYAFYPVPIIEYEQAIYDGSISIVKDKTLKHILYNADGRNPLYNENQGVFFNFSEDNQTSLTVSWEAVGGLDGYENTPAFDLYYDKDILKNSDTIVYAADTLSNKIEYCPYIYIKPKDVYAGAAQNNHVRATVYSKAVVDGAETTVKIATVYIPIYMSLNLYGLASLNAWDGNTIEINEDNNYIMAPQIGAGVKNEDNTFTGIVMGKATTYDMEKEQVGLLGYSSGRQSIFLDAETGNATFGLPEQDERDPNQQNLNEGRIELRPGGLSSIANWKINSRMLFNIPEANADNSEEYNTWGGLSEPYADLGSEYLKSIPHDKSGVLISSDPSYISIKGRPLVTNRDIDFTLTNTIVKPDDTFELQLNPNDDSIFTIYRHTKTAKNPDMGVKTKEDGSLYVGVVFVADNETDAEEDFTEYSVPRMVNGEIVGWTALIQDPQYKEYLIPRRYTQTRKNVDGTESTKIVWSIRAVPNPGYYPVTIFDSEETDPSIWRREKRVGINEQGRFYTNALRSSSSALNIDNVGAFGKSADTGKYVGASFEVGMTEDDSYSLIKMFTSTGTNNENLNNPAGTLYISGSSDDEDEYIRPVRLYGKSVTLLADDTGENDTYYAKNRVRVDGHSAFIGNVESTDGFEEEKAPKSGSYLFFDSERKISDTLSSKDETQLRSLYHFNTIVGQAQDPTDEDYPWLLNNFKVPVISETNSGVADQITKISYGSIANYTYGGSKTDIAGNYSGGHILNYATGSLQLNKAKQLTNEATDDEGNPIPATYGIDKTLQINDNNVLLGNVDTLKVEDENRSAWKSTADNYIIGTLPLVSKITEGFRLQADNDGTTLVSEPRIGVYSQNGIDISERSGFGVYIGSGEEKIVNEQRQDSYLLLKSDVTDGDSIRLSGKHGSLEFNGNARKNLQGTGLASNGAYINPGIHTGYGIFNGVITTSGTYAGASIYAAKDIYLNNFSWSGAWNDERLTNMGTNTDHYLTYILVKMYRALVDKIDEVEGKIPSLSEYATQSWVSSNFSGTGHSHSSYVSKETYNKHLHGFSYNQVNGLVSMIVSSGGDYNTVTQTASPQA